MAVHHQAQSSQIPKNLNREKRRCGGGRGNVSLFSIKDEDEVYCFTIRKPGRQEKEDELR